MPKVSVIVPNYNHSKFLHQRLESIFNQTYQDFEVILLDDCSTDNSCEVLEQYRKHPKVSNVIFNQENSGSTFSQWKRGIENSSGEYIWIAESDDYCEKEFLKTLVNALDNLANAGVAYCQSISINSDGIFIRNWIEHTKTYDPNIWNYSFCISGKTVIKNFFLYRNVIPNASGVLFRRKIYLETTGFAEEMKLNGDWLFWIKMLEKSDLIFLNENFNFFRQHGHKATEINSENFNNIIEYCKIYFHVKNSITKYEKTDMLKAIISMWINQVLFSKIKNSIRSFPIIVKLLYMIDNHFYIQLITVIKEILLIRIFKHSSKKKYVNLGTPDIQFL